jgi:hypothetical protein
MFGGQMAPFLYGSDFGLGAQDPTQIAKGVGHRAQASVVLRLGFRRAGTGVEASGANSDWNAGSTGGDSGTATTSATTSTTWGVLHLGHERIHGFNRSVDHRGRIPSATCGLCAIRVRADGKFRSCGCFTRGHRLRGDSTQSAYSGSNGGGINDGHCAALHRGAGPHS